MRKLLVILSLILALGMTAAQGQEVLGITPGETQMRMTQNAYLNLFDLRPEDVYDMGHIPGAVNFPLSTLQSDMQAILNSGFSYMEAEIIVYGQDPTDGEEAARILAQLGFTNVRSLGAFSSWTGEIWSTEMEIARQRQIMNQFATLDIFGNEVTEALLAGHRLTMVNVWATYCNPCISEMPELGKLARDWAEKGVQVVGLLSDATSAAGVHTESKVELAREIVDATQADYPHLLPSAELIQNVLSLASAVPTTFFVDETGTLVGDWYVGARSYAQWNAIIEQQLEALPEEGAGL